MKKHVVFVVPKLAGGGAERVMAMLANQMVIQGISVTFLMTLDSEKKYDLDNRIGIVVNKGKKSPLAQMLFIRKYAALHKNNTFISFFTYQNIYLLLATKLLKCKVIVSERNDPRRTTHGRKSMEVLRKFLYAGASNVVFQTRDAKEYFDKRIQKKGIIIENPLSIEDLPEIYDGNREKNIVAVARINKQKNLPMMMKALASVFATRNDYCFKLYGQCEPGDEQLVEDLKGMTVQLGISEKVKFVGFRSNVSELIRKDALYVSSSDFEGISNSMLEALAIGLPAVCTDCPVGGARMYIKNGKNGFLTPVGDDKCFSQAILDTIEHYEKMESEAKKCAQQLRNQLKISSICEKWIKLI